MYKFIFILYIVIFSSYVLFSRQPDYFDGEFAPAAIHFTKDSISQKLLPMAYFSVGVTRFTINTDYLFRRFKEGEKVEVIYESSNPKKAVVYLFWGYWITWGEIVASIILWLVLFQVAVGITQNPTPEALIEQLESIPEKKTKYD